MVMIDKGFPEICLFQSDGIKKFVQIQNKFHDFVDTKYKIMRFILHLDRIWTEMFLCHPIEMSLSLECLY